MAANADLSIILKLQDDATKTLNGFKKELKQFDKDMQSIGNIGAGMTAGITMPFIAGAAVVTKFAMDAVESKNLFDVAMGDMSEAGMSFSRKMNDAYKLNETGVRTNLATMYNMTTGMGLSEDAAYQLSEGITKLGYDLASFRNLPIEVAFEKLRSGITGEMEPLKALGIIVSDTTITNWALTNGLIKQGQEMSEQQKVIARYNVIMAQTKNDQGDLARTIESPSNQLRIMGEQFRTVAEIAGNEFLPGVSNALLWINNEGFPLVMAGMEGFKKGWAETSEESQSNLRNIAIALLAGGPLLVGLSFAYNAVVAASTAFRVLRIKALAEIAIIAKGFYEITKLNTAVTLMTTQGSESFGDWGASYGTASAVVDNNIRDLMDSLTQWGLEVVGGTALAENFNDAVGDLQGKSDAARASMDNLAQSNNVGAAAFKAAGGAAQKAGAQTKSAYDEAKQAIDKVKGAMQDLANTPLAGERAADDKVFAIEQQIKQWAVERSIVLQNLQNKPKDVVEAEAWDIENRINGWKELAQRARDEASLLFDPQKREIQRMLPYQEFTPEQIKFGIAQYAQVAKDIEMGFYRSNPSMVPGAGIVSAVNQNGTPVIQGQGGDMAKEMIAGIAKEFDKGDLASKLNATVAKALEQADVKVGPWRINSKEAVLTVEVKIPSATSGGNNSSSSDTESERRARGQ